MITSVMIKKCSHGTKSAALRNFDVFLCRLLQSVICKKKYIFFFV
jgi:hypothetical protein